MGLLTRWRRRAIPFIGGVCVFFLCTPVSADHSAATIDDTGSIFDETPSAAPDRPSAPPPRQPVIVPKPVEPNPDPVGPRVKPQTPVKPKVTIKPPAPTGVSPSLARPKKLPVPDANARTASLKLVHEVYREDYAKTGPAEQRSLAQRLFDQSRDTNDDAAAQYVLLTEASNRAATAGDATLAMKAVRGLARTFKTDAPTAALAALTLASKARVTADQLNATARAALDLSREAVMADELATAGAAVEIAQAAARRGNDIKLQKSLKLQADRVNELQHGADAIKDLALRLKVEPENPEACLAVGRYRCFIRGDWSPGIRLLSRSEDALLKPLASKDIALRDVAADPNETVTPEQAIAMADAWWTASEQTASDATLKLGLQTRACYWYARATSGLSGLKRVTIEKRLSAVRLSRLKPGLVAHYFNNHTFSHEALERIDTQINFNWKEGPPTAGVSFDNFSVWWHGYIKAPVPGKYKLVVDHDDTCRVIIDGKIVFDRGDIGVHTAVVDCTTDAQMIDVHYHEMTGPARMGLGWYVPGSDKPAPIPPPAFFHEPDGPMKVPLPRPAKLERFNGHAYMTFDQKVPWYNARQWCLDMGGHLTFIETPDEQQFVRDIVAGRALWIGLNDEEEEGVWRWADGRLARYFAWGPQDPNEGEAANFVTMWENTWADTVFGTLGFVCEWDD